MSDSFRNYAERADADDAIVNELIEAGINVHRLPESLRNTHPEMRTIVMGELGGWSFKRAWRYWICEGPGIEVETAERLHATYGNEVRVDGHCGCPSPREQFNGLACGLYHVDTQTGLNALANTIRELVQKLPDSEPPKPILPPNMALLRSVWRAALTLANNLCVQESNRVNDDDGDTGWIHGTAECANRIRGWLEPENDQLIDMLDEFGVSFAARSNADRELEELKRLMFKEKPWITGCEIIPNYMPPHPTEGTWPKLVVRYKAGENYAYLRHSNGPLQGYSWDMYGDDFQSEALATLALYHAPPPRNVDPIKFTLPIRGNR